jgi:hypothetical protein
VTRYPVTPEVEVFVHETTAEASPAVAVGVPVMDPVGGAKGINPLFDQPDHPVPEAFVAVTPKV